MDFKEFVEHWAKVYTPLHHTPELNGKNKRFFFCEGFAKMADWLHSADVKKTPVVLMDSSASVVINSSGWEYHDYTLYFAVRAKKPNDSAEASVCFKEAEAHARQFLLYVKKHENDFKKNMMIPDLERVNLNPYGPLWDSWWLVQMTITIAEGQCKEIDEALIDEE